MSEESPAEVSNLNPTLSATWVGAGVYEKDYETTGELIRYQNALCRVAQSDDGSCVIKRHTVSSLFVLLATVDMPHVQAMLDAPDTVDVPVVRSVVLKPVHGLDGELIEQPGYLSEVQVWYQPIDLSQTDSYMIVRGGEGFELVERTFE
ncbi:hypothetical protein [Phytoactinopolyspora mesophila]|uniref:Uncharacterized protein n=1 Tax=Phytoactinopolyspora mesophila TaxID=2650750 RepID=A0A7K3M885_9ACTN|nr:hypothetical protein [Phytoactinopolyspora mesophila]NDL58618.1 hypothetical protein [Phytoactinopolyspora mesophila]